MSKTKYNLEKYINFLVKDYALIYLISNVCFFLASFLDYPADSYHTKQG